MRHLFAILLLSLAAHPAIAGDRDADTFNAIESVNQATNNAEKMQKQLDVPYNKFEKEGLGKAGEISSFYYSEGFQNQLAAERERLKTTIFRDYFPEAHYTDSNPDRSSSTNRQILGPSERIYIFISSSIPVETIRAYVRDMDKIGDSRIVLIMNGFVDGIGSFKKMLDFIDGIKARDPGCNLRKGECSFYKANLQIDPLLFRKYGVASVPAVVYARGGSLANGDRPDHDAEVSSYYLIRGDASFEHQIESIIRESKSVSLEALAASISAGFYDKR